MKRLMITDQAACMACLQCANACSRAFYKSERPDWSCIQIIERNGAIKTNVCVQCGKCAKACPAEAIAQNDKGVYMIDRKKCKNCGECVAACPFSVLVKAPDRDVPSKCISCGICAKECPMAILYIKEA